MKRVLLFIITILSVCGCADKDKFPVNSIYFKEGHDITIRPGEEYTPPYGIYINENGYIHQISHEEENGIIIQWESSNQEVANVIDGTIYGCKPGTAVITVSAEGYNAKVRVYVVEENSQALCFGPLMIELIDVAETTAKFKAYFDFDPGIDINGEYSFVSCKGEYWGGYIPTAEDATKIVIKEDTNIELTNLWPGSMYSYAIGGPCLTENNYSWHTDGNFTTSFQEDSIFDLSAKGTANCYIVPKKGTFRFKATKGNGDYVPTGTVKVLWETFGSYETITRRDLIEDITFERNGRYILFKTNNTFKDGNALIAAYGDKEEITWSWHIWFTEQEPREVQYKNDSGIMMDRNLGALSSTPDFRANGLLYQWGRKDPFIGSSSKSESTPALNTGTWPIPVISDYSRGTIDYSIAHPTTFICSNSNGDWDYDLTPDRWTSSENEKSKYDPCPAGWRVPDGGNSGVWAKATGKTSDFDSNNEFAGILGTSEESIYYPCAGIYDPEDGELVYGSRYFACWSSTTKNDKSDDTSYAFIYSTYSSYGNFAHPTAALGRATGASIRCMKDQNDKTTSIQ